MEGAGRTRSRLLLVLVLVAGLLAGGAAGLRTAPPRAPAAAQTVALHVVATTAASATYRSPARTGAPDRGHVAVAAAAGSCVAAGGSACPPVASAGVPDLRGALVGRLPRPPGPPSTAPPSTQQDRAPPRPAGH